MNPEMIAYITQINHRDDYPVTSEQNPKFNFIIIFDWYFIKPYATYYQDANTHSLSIIDSPLTSDSEIDYSNSSKTQKIVVNVIDDNSSLITTPKSNNNEIKRIYTSPNNIIGSRTMEDLFQVINNRKSTSMTEHVIIIDRDYSDSTNNEKQQLQTFEIHTSTPITTNTISITPSTGYTVQQLPTYYNSQQPEMYMSMPSNIYLTTSYISYANSFYPFVYYQY